MKASDVRHIDCQLTMYSENRGHSYMVHARNVRLFTMELIGYTVRGSLLQISRRYW